MSDPESKGRNRVAKKIARMAARGKMGEAKCADSRIPSFPLFPLVSPPPSPPSGGVSLRTATLPAG